MNNLRTVILLGALTGLFLFIGGMVGGRSGMIIALVFAGIMNIAAYWFSDKIVLRTYGAQPLSESQAPDIHHMVEELCQEAGIPKPRIYVINEESPNAFATGRNPRHGAIALSTGIIKVMNREELRGVIAHELSHIRHRDTLIQTAAATIAGAIMFLAYQMRWFAFLGGGSDDDEGGGILGLLLMAILAPIAAVMIQMAISRSREYKADEGAAALAHNPEGLASGLEKLGHYTKRIPMRATHQTAHLFIVSPLSGKSLMNLFSTHPPLEERVARLRAMRYQ
ncbi:MAG: zinc metalloprotease HtpX [Candidatus Aminicenantes bacterium]|nr:MAG: zinc metalloprotease HtpX [Candidatus Aminicenantes bacterium]